MKSEKAIKLFEDKRVRVHWDPEAEKWFFSIVDTVAILTDSPNPRTYWSVLKTRLKKEGSELATNCSQLKMQSADGKYYRTDVADTEQLFRLIQSVPSPKAEPFKLWLARVGRERIDEIEDPEIGIDRLMETYLRKGYSKEWINQRLKSIEVRKDLTDEWDTRGVQKGREYAILTDDITQAWSGLNTRQYRAVKEEGEPPRSYDQPGAGVEYACRGYDDRDIQTAKAERLSSKPHNRTRRRDDRRKHTKGDRRKNRQKGRYFKKFQTAHSEFRKEKAEKLTKKDTLETFAL